MNAALLYLNHVAEHGRRFHVVLDPNTHGWKWRWEGVERVKITSQRLLDQNCVGPHVWETPTYPPFGPICVPYPKRFTPFKIIILSNKCIPLIFWSCLSG